MIVWLFFHSSIFQDYDDGSITKQSLTGTSVTSTNDVSIASYERTCDIFRLATTQNGGGAHSGPLCGGGSIEDNVSILSTQLDLCSLPSDHAVAPPEIVLVPPEEVGDDGDEDDDEVTEKQLSE
ncbi:hypothetical protein pipiens_009380 [Culex pipiens pipiens]|uniref:Uncharacterized protein n=1 Tax=Culex pipiens pipiens TaxID=38569 RepID=A0ABD1DEQ5_CULPP